MDKINVEEVLRLIKESRNKSNETLLFFYLRIAKEDGLFCNDYLIQMLIDQLIDKIDERNEEHGFSY